MAATVRWQPARNPPSGLPDPGEPVRGGLTASRQSQCRRCHAREILNWSAVGIPPREPADFSPAPAFRGPQFAQSMHLQSRFAPFQVNRRLQISAF
ncbi:hypothetical protein KSP39_PZI009432 [Platanthera zijinensis]|uniref:Uncharacterized protein n=1 Tax=Platanthera zijinensis TaxID=2320716 RepID=A0AAP0BJW5_9ASPA